MSPIYEDSNTTREKLYELRKKNRCQVCSGRLDVFMDFDRGEAFLACWDWPRTHHEGIERLAAPPFEPNIVTRRKDMEEELGKGKADALAKYVGQTSLQKVELQDIIETLWPEAPPVEKAKAIMLCATYGLNPLNKHIFLIPFNKGEPDETWALVMSIHCKRLLASRRGPTISSPTKEAKSQKIGAPAEPPDVSLPKTPVFKNWGELAQAAQSLGVMPSDIFTRAGVKKWEDFTDFRDAWNYVEEIVTERTQSKEPWPKML